MTFWTIVSRGEGGERDVKSSPLVEGQNGIPLSENASTLAFSHSQRFPALLPFYSIENVGDNNSNVKSNLGNGFNTSLKKWIIDGAR